MPSNPLSLRLTATYRNRLDATRQRLQSFAASTWPTIEELDSSDWVDRAAASVAQAQTEAVRATGGYLTAFLTLELGKRTKGPTVESRSYSGIGADGSTLAESLRSPIVGVLARLKQGSEPSDALRYGLDRAKRQVGMDFDAAHRKALLEAIDRDPHFDGWQRATRGTCGACLGVAAKVQSGLHFPVHPGCHCISEPVVSGVPQSVTRATGAELFAGKSEDEQNEAVGPLAAQLLREGRIELSQLVEEQHLDSDTADFITQRPVDQLVTSH